MKKTDNSKPLLTKNLEWHANTFIWWSKNGEKI